MPKCNALDNHVCVDTEVRFRPCCVFRKRSGNTIEAGGLDWSTYNLTFLSEVKHVMETGWHPGCESCNENQHQRNNTGTVQKFN